MQSAVPPPFLADSGKWLEFALAPYQVSNKLAAIRRHHSQFLHAAAYLEPFIRKTEVFNEIYDLSFPHGTGSVEIAETDTTQFKPNPDLFRELSQESDAWNDIAGQNEQEMDSLDGFDNEFTQCTLTGDGTGLTLAFRFRKAVAQPVSLSVRLYSYRADTGFGDMPKIEIAANSDGLRDVLDLDGPAPQTAACQAGSGKEISIRAPYSLLGNPEHVLISAQLMKGTLPIAGIPSLVLDLGEMPPVVSAPALPVAAPSQPPPAPATPVLNDKPIPVPASPARPSPLGPPSAAKPDTKPVVKPEPPPAPPTLAPRVNLPNKHIPDHTEANEPVQW